MQYCRKLDEILPLNTQEAAELASLIWDKLTHSGVKLPPQMPKLPPNIISFTRKAPEFIGAGIQLTKHQRDAPSQDLAPEITMAIMLLKQLMLKYNCQPSRRLIHNNKPAWDKCRLYHTDMTMKVVLTENWAIGAKIISRPKLLRRNGELIMSPSAPLLSFELPTEPKDAH